MAATEVIQDYHNQKRITVTRVAGTSAGSIVACLLGAGISIDAVRQSIKAGKGKELIDAFPLPSTRAALWKLFRGTPVWDVTPLRKWIGQLFGDKQFNQIRDFKEKNGIEVFLVASDLTHRRPVISAPDEFIEHAVVDSCALPFLFRIWNPDGGRVIVDGGICENLPFSPLADGTKLHGDVVALSFPLTASESPSGLKSFFLSLLDAAISSSMAQTRSKMHPRFIFELQTKLTTFSFDKALSSGLDDEYDKIKIQTQKWLDEFIREKRAGIDVAQSDPWKDPNPTAQYLLGRVFEIFDSIFRQQLIKYERCRFSITVNSLREKARGDPYENNPDMAEIELKFHAGQSPIHALSMGLVFGALVDTKFHGETAQCRIKDSEGNDRGLISIPVVDQKDTATRELCLFFAPPLDAGSGPYTLTFREEGRNLMPELVTKGIEPLGFLPQRADGPIKRMELVLYAPKAAKVFMSPPPGANQGRQMSGQELAGCHPPHGDLRAFGWVGEVVSEKDWGCIVHRHAE
jgi:predicted acylesterase/phospholipase RssA